MDFVDLTPGAAQLLAAPVRAAGLREWLDGAPPWVQVGFSGYRERPGDEGWERFLDSRIGADRFPAEAVLRLIESAGWRALVDRTLERVEELVPDALDAVTVVAAVGLGARNASQGYWRGRGIAFLWLERFLPPEQSGELAGLGVDAIPLWLSHEIAHAARYSIAGSRSLLPQACDGSEPWEFWDRLDRLPLAERLHDEGLASAFSRAVVPDAEPRAALGFNPDEFEWLQANARALLAERQDAWDFLAPSPDPAWVAECLGMIAGRCDPPFSLQHPPCRWGYFVGLQSVARADSSDWAALLASEAPGPPSLPS